MVVECYRIWLNWFCFFKKNRSNRSIWDVYIVQLRSEKKGPFGGPNNSPTFGSDPGKQFLGRPGLSLDDWRASGFCGGAWKLWIFATATAHRFSFFLRYDRLVHLALPWLAAWTILFSRWKKRNKVYFNASNKNELKQVSHACWWNIGNVVCVPFTWDLLPNWLVTVK